MSGKRSFYILLGDTRSFDRWIHIYAANPDIVPLEDRREMAAALDELFDRVNSEVNLALASLEAMLNKAPDKKRPTV
jgi:hypothetical protein